MIVFYNLNQLIYSCYYLLMLILLLSEYPLKCQTFFMNSFLLILFLISRKEAACNTGDLGLIPGSRRSPGKGNGNPLQHSCLENPMDRGAWWATVHGVTTVGHDLMTKTHTHTPIPSLILFIRQGPDCLPSNVIVFYFPIHLFQKGCNQGVWIIAF